MKPRLVIAETTLPDGTRLSLQEHDQRRSLMVDGLETAGPRTRHGEREMARIACAPFRPARQPKIWIAGLGLGELLAAARTELPQKRGSFVVAEPSAELVSWHAEHLPHGAPTADPRVSIERDPGAAALARHAGVFHGILVHADIAPASPSGGALHEDRKWLAAAYEALLAGGLLAVASSVKLPQLGKALERNGFETVLHEIDALPSARRPRKHSLWLGRKGGR